MIDLKGKPIAITGASSGIGLATALACAKAGMPVALAARRIERLEEAAERIRTGGGKAIAVQCDVNSKDDCKRLIEKSSDAFGPIYSVFANAGYGVESPVETMEEEKIRAIFETNFYGTLYTIWPAAEQMRRHGRGHILICSSCASKIAIPNFAAYSATKAAQDHFGRAMRLEMRKTGIHVSTVHPIGTDTEFSEQVEQRSQRPRGATRTPLMFRQSADTVAKAVVKCLHKPKGEVWTSLPMRTLLATGTLFPGFADVMMARLMKDAKPGE